MKIYSFGLGEFNDDPSIETLGGKGAGLVFMSENGVNVPPGFILPTQCWAEYTANPTEFMADCAAAIAPWLGKLSDKFGYQPLLSVRSGARVSCPGMMDTVLNVGIDSKTRKAWVERIGADCVYDSERRLVEMYAATVHGVDKTVFAECKNLSQIRKAYQKAVGAAFPSADMQILGAIEAVFKSWNNDRARIYRKLNNIPDDWGTAVTVQAMVFGNMNDKSATGVLFTRNANTGHDDVDGEFLVNAQGEDVVAGVRTPTKLPEMAAWNPDVALELQVTAEKLEQLRGDVQDVEFTIQNGELFILQTRTAKRSPQAAVKIGVDLYREGVIDLPTLFKRVSLADYDKAQQRVVDPGFNGVVTYNGISACPGVATGIIVQDAASAIDCKSKGVPCILVTEETNPDDIAGMHAADGIITMTGGSTSHAAVVARGMNKPCIVGVGADLNTFIPGFTLSMDGATGRIWDGDVPVIDGTDNPAAREYLGVLREAYGYTPIVTGNTAGAACAEVVYHVPAGVSPTQVRQIATGLLATAERVYIDVRASRVDEAETAFNLLFDAPVLDYPGQVYEEVSTLVPALQERITLITDLSFSGMVKTMTEINSLRALVLADGPSIMGDLPHDDPAVARVLAWRSSEIEIVSYGKLTAGTKSFISDEQALLSR